MMNKKEDNDTNKTGRESIYLSERFMTAACLFAVVAGVICFIIGKATGDFFSLFEITVKLVTTVAMYFAFRRYNWDVAKGLMGGVLFCLMYQEAHLVLARLWGEEDFDT